MRTWHLVLSHLFSKSTMSRAMHLSSYTTNSSSASRKLRLIFQPRFQNSDFWTQISNLRLDMFPLMGETTGLLIRVWGPSVGLSSATFDVSSLFFSLNISFLSTGVFGSLVIKVSICVWASEQDSFSVNSVFSSVVNWYSDEESVSSVSTSKDVMFSCFDFPLLLDDNEESSEALAAAATETASFLNSRGLGISLLSWEIANIYKMEVHHTLPYLLQFEAWDTRAACLQ